MTEPIDVDASWDGKGSLDEHREKALAKIKQPGFGQEQPKVKAEEPEPVQEVTTDGGN